MAGRLSRLIRGLGLATLACASLGAAVADDASGHHILWSVQGKHNTVYLLGSIHVLRPGDGGLPAVAEAAYADAEKLVMEIDLDDARQGDPVAMATTMQRMATLPPGQTLRSVLGEDYPAVAARARKAGLDLTLLDAYAPWFVGTTLLQLELASRGFSPELGIEETLASRAKADHKPIEGLETAEQQFAILAGLPLPQQKRFLMMTLDESDQMDQELDAVLKAWRNGDTETLARLLSEEFDEFPELYRPLTEDRNRAWVDKLAKLLDSDSNDDYLVVVGALHLVGHGSVVDLLRQRGYRVTQQ